MLETSGVYIDIVKLGWGTAYVTQNLAQKLEILRARSPSSSAARSSRSCTSRARSTSTSAGSTDLGLTHVEISDGTVEIPREEKLELIADLARDFTVLSEVGSKDSEVNFAPYLWVQWIKEELEAGAWKVITEARESGTAGIFRPSGEMRTGLIDEIVNEIDGRATSSSRRRRRPSQAWFVKEFGPTVNLGNIPPDEVIPLETLRLGLRGDTLKEVLLPDERARTS